VRQVTREVVRAELVLGIEAFGLEDILHGRQQVGVIVYEQDLQSFWFH